MASFEVVFAGLLIAVGAAAWVRTRRLAGYLTSLRPAPLASDDVDHIIGVL